MSERISDEQLNDYVDGALPEAEAAEVERLMASSAEVREAVDFLRSLRAAAADLPASIEPQRDLWPHIEGRMAPAPLAVVDEDSVAAPGPSAAAWWPRLSTSQWATLAAAALFLVVSSSALTAWIVGAAPLPAAAVAPAEAVSLAEPVPVEARYAAEIEELMWSLYENRESLDPETVSTIETNMRVIDRAIRRAREALEEDPANAGLSRMLDTNYRHKLQLLQRANRIIEMS